MLLDAQANDVIDVTADAEPHHADPASIGPLVLLFSLILSAVLMTSIVALTLLFNRLQPR